MLLQTSMNISFLSTEISDPFLSAETVWILFLSFYPISLMFYKRRLLLQAEGMTIKALYLIAYVPSSNLGLHVWSMKNVTALFSWYRVMFYIDSCKSLEPKFCFMFHFILNHLSMLLYHVPFLIYRSVSRHNVNSINIAQSVVCNAYSRMINESVTSMGMVA